MPKRRLPIGYIFLAVSLLLVGYVGYLIYQFNRINNEFGICASHIYNVSTALLTYAADHGDRLPPANQWTEDIREYVLSEESFYCPAHFLPGKSSYAINSNVTNKRLQDVSDPTHTVLVYETIRINANPQGTGSNLPRPAMHFYPRPGAHLRVNFLVTVDGKLHNSSDEIYPSLHW